MLSKRGLTEKQIEYVNRTYPDTSGTVLYRLEQYMRNIGRKRLPDDEVKSASEAFDSIAKAAKYQNVFTFPSYRSNVLNVDDDLWIAMVILNKTKARDVLDKYKEYVEGVKADVDDIMETRWNKDCLTQVKDMVSHAADEYDKFVEIIGGGEE